MADVPKKRQIPKVRVVTPRVKILQSRMDDVEERLSRVEGNIRLLLLVQPTTPPKEERKAS